jgi:hypothetical protein
MLFSFIGKTAMSRFAATGLSPLGFNIWGSLTDIQPSDFYSP